MAPELCDVLQDFRQDLDAFFRAQKKHNSTRQRLQDVYLRLLRASPAEPGPVGPVGIAGVGKSSESPESKGSKAKRQAISLQELGGEALIRELLVAFLAEQRQVSQQEIRQSMQDVWVDEIGETFARVSVLFSKPKPECTQLALYRSGTRWQVAHAMQDEESLAMAGAVPRHLEASRLQEALQAADARSPRSKDSKAAAASETEKHVRPMPKKLVGKSPFFRPKDVSKLFEEIDTDGDGQLSREDLLPYLRDYLGFGHAEVLNFLEAHRSSNSGVDLADFKRGLKELNPYAVHNRDHKLIVRKPHAFGGIEGVDFHLEDCTGCTCLICDRSEEFKVDALTNCRVLIGPCSSSTFIRNCENCTFWVATKQFRVRDCSHCTFYLHCHTEPVIEASKDLRIAPFHATYPGLKKQFQDAGFEAQLNFWNAVYDFTGNSKDANWSIPALDECEKLVVTFEGSDEIPEEATPELTQELLVADPLESSESHGQSVASVPQTRPQAPASASPKRLRRCISDAAQEISGRLEAVMLSEREVTHSKMPPKRGEEVERPEKKADTVEEVEILDMDENLERPQQAKDLALGPTGPGTGCLGSSQKARAAAWSTPGAGEPPNRSRPLGGLRLMSGGAAAEAETKPKRCKNCDNTGIHFLGKTCTCPFGKKILNDSSDEDMIFAPRAAKGSSEATGATGATAKASSAAARQKIGEKIGVLMSSLDSDEEPLDPPAALSERQRRLLKEGLAGLGVARISNRAGDASSSEEEIIVEDEVPAVPAIPLRAAATPGSESTSESDDDAFLRWQNKTSRATSRNAAISD